METKFIVCLLIAIAFVADVATFLYKPSVQIFEINPIFVALKAAWLLILVKTIAISILIWFVYNPYKVNKTLYYSILLSAIYMVLLQGLGAYSNMKTVIDNPAPSQAMPAAQATQTYLLIALAYYLLPIAIATLSYWLHSKIYSDSMQHRVEKTIVKSYVEMK